jgi:hypothetical protein
MKKYKVVSDCLKWRKGSQIELKRLPYTCSESFYTQGLDGPDYIPDSVMQELIATGLVQKIEEEKVKDYEVIASKTTPYPPGWAITAVSRLSDGVEFKVGQDGDAGGYRGKINAFQVIDEKLYCNFDCQDGKGYSVSIAEISPLPEKKVLFTTEDNVKVYDGDHTYLVEPDWGFRLHGPNEFNGCDGKYFSTREAAEEWVIKNKPNVFSWDEIQMAKHDSADLSESGFNNWAKEIARKRLGFPQPQSKDQSWTKFNF